MKPFDTTQGYQWLHWVAIDILAWYQMENARPLNKKFMITVLGMCCENGEILNWPKIYDSSKASENPALETAKMVCRIKYARDRSGQHTGTQYAESL